MRIVSFFSGAGGLDRGFELAKFNVVWANEYDKKISKTYQCNFPKTKFDSRSIADLQPDDVPKCDGIIGGPPCQSWSEAGMLRGADDHRGQLFFKYIELIASKRPLFFFAENVSGITLDRNKVALKRILRNFSKIGYNVSYHLLNANDYGVPQDRERLIIVGYLAQYEKHFVPPDPQSYRPTLKDAIWDIRKTAVPATNKNKRNAKAKKSNHEYMTGGFSSIFMSRNRVRPWNLPSFTIQASGRHAPIHPQAPKMIPIEKDVHAFDKKGTYRRLSVRECARIQTFRDSHRFIYDNVADGYKMVGNAVPVNFATALAKTIMSDVSKFDKSKREEIVQGTIIAGNLKRRRKPLSVKHANSN